jgi:hypothetical protein
MIYAYIVLLFLAAAAAVITTFQTVLTVLLRRRRRRPSDSILPAGRFGRTGTFRFDPEATLRTR